MWFQQHTEHAVTCKPVYLNVNVFNSIQTFLRHRVSAKRRPICFAKLTFFLFFYSLEHILERPLNPSSPNRARDCIPSVLRKIRRAFSVSCFLLNFRDKTTYFNPFSVAAHLSAVFCRNDVTFLNCKTTLS